MYNTALIKAAKSIFNKKIFCIIITLVLLSTVFTQSISALNLKEQIPNENNENRIKRLNDETKKNLEYNQHDLKNYNNQPTGKIKSFSSNFENLVENIKSKLNIKSSSDNVFLKTFTNLKNSLFSTFLYIKYEEVEKTSSIGLFKPAYIDINNDGKDDIKANFQLFLGFVRPLSFSFNLKLEIDRLVGFENLDENAFFESFIEFQRSGLLSPKNAGDKIYFGFQSPQNEKIPGSCDVVYKLVPHFLTFLKKPEHRIQIIPDDETIGSEKLTTILSYKDMNSNSFVSEDKILVHNNPAAKTEILFMREPGGIVYIERSQQTNSKVDVIVEHRETSKRNYVYIEDFPKKVTLTIDAGSTGYIEINTHGNKIKKVGVTDNLANPLYDFHFSDVDGSAGVQWQGDFDEGKTFLTIYCDDENTAFNADLIRPGIGSFYTDISSQSPFECDISLDLSKSEFILSRSNKDLSVNFFASIVDETLGEFVNNVQGSFNITNSFTSPVIFNFADISSGQTCITLSGSELSIDDLDFNVYSPFLDGTFALQIDHLQKTKQGNITAALSVENTGDVINGNSYFEVTNGVKIHGFKLQYNDLVFHEEQLLDISGYYNQSFSFTLEVQVEWHIYDDWGYVLIKPGSSASFSFSSYYWDDNGVLIGMTEGILTFQTQNEVFNISWVSVDDRKVYTMDGSGIAELEDFQFYFKDTADISISYVKGSFLLEDASKESGYLLMDIEIDQSYMGFNTDISIKLQNTTFNDEEVDFQLDTHIENLYITGDQTTVSLELEWQDEDVTIFNIESEGDIDIGVDDLDIFIYKRRVENSTFFYMTNVSGYITGHAGVNAELTLPNFRFNLTDTDVYLHIDDLKNINESGNGTIFGEITLELETIGKVCFYPHDFTKFTNEDDYTVPIYWNNLTIDIDATSGSLLIKNLDIENFYIYGRFHIQNFSITGESSVQICLGIMGSGMPLFLCLNFDNQADTSVTFENFTFMFPLDILPDYPFYVKLYDAELVEGTFNLFSRLFRVVAVNITDGSAVDNLAVEIGNPNFTQPLSKILENFTDIDIILPEKSIFVYLEFDQPFDVFNFDLLASVKVDPYNEDIVTETKDYIHLNTTNETVPVNVFAIVTKELINYYSNELDLHLPEFENDLGIRFNDVDVQADSFFIHLGDLIIYERPFNPNNVSIEGYLKLAGQGNFWLLYRDLWHKMIGGGQSEIIVQPGHIQITVDQQLTLPQDTFIVDGYEVTIGGTFIGDNCIVDIWWDRDTGEITIESDADVTINNLVLDISEEISVSADTLSIDTEYINGGISFDPDYYDVTNIEIDAVINSIYTENLYFDVIKESDESQVLLNGNLDFTLNGNLNILTDLQDYIEINLTDGDSTIEMTDFEIIVKDTNGDIAEGTVFSAELLYLDGEGSFKIGDIIVIDADINSFNIDGGHINIPETNSDIRLNADITCSFTGPLYIETDQEQNIITFQMNGAGEVTLSDFEINLTNSGTNINGKILQFIFSGPAFFEMSDEIIIDSSITELYAEECKFNTPRNSLNIDGDISFSFIGRMYIKADRDFNILELEMDGSGEISFTDFDIEIARGKAKMYGDILRMVFNEPAFLKMTDEIVMDANFSEIYLANCVFVFPSKDMVIDGDIDFSFDGEIHLRSDIGLNNIEFELDGVGQIEFKNFDIDVYDGYTIFEGERFVIRGSGVLTISNTIELDALLWSVYFKNCHFKITGYNLHINGTIDTEDVLSGGVSLYANTDFSYYEIQIAVYGTLTLTDFNINVNNGDIVISASEMIFTGLGYAKLGSTIEIGARIDAFQADNVYINTTGAQISKIILDCNLVLSTSGTFYVLTDLEDYIKFKIIGDSSTHLTGSIKVNVNDLIEVEFIDIDLTAGEIIFETDSSTNYIFIGTYNTNLIATFYYGKIKLPESNLIFTFEGSGSYVSLEGDIEFEWTGQMSQNRPESLKLTSVNGFTFSLNPITVYVNYDELMQFGGTAEFEGLLYFDEINWDYNNNLVGISIPSQTDFQVNADVDFSFFNEFEFYTNAYFALQGALSLDWNYDYEGNINYFQGLCTDFSFDGEINVEDVFSFESDLSLDGEITYDTNPKSVYIGGTGSHNINLTIYASTQYLIRSTATSFDGSFYTQWGDDPSSWDVLVNAQINTLTHITDLSITRKYIDKVKVKNMQVSQTTFNVMYEHEDFYIIDFDGSITFDSFVYKDLVDTFAKINTKYLSINGDFSLEDTGSTDTIYLESQSGFSITNSDGLIEVGDESFYQGFYIQGDLTLTTTESTYDGTTYKSSNYSTENGLDTYISTQKGLFGLVVDLDIDPGYLKVNIVDFPRMYDGAVSIDSSYLTGELSVLFSFDNLYGADISVNSWIDFDHYTINWEPVLGGLAPGDWQIDGDVSFGVDFNIDFSENIPQDDWFNVYPACLPGNQAPVAVFTWTPNTPEAGETVTFDATDSYDPDPGGIVSYIRWDWGEGNGWTDWHFYAGWKIVEHTYYSEGDYNVRCQVADLRSKTSDITTHTITVGSGTGQWTLADYHIDPDDAWNSETNAYDGDTSTRAGCTIGSDYPKWDWVWTPYIELHFNNPVDISKIRFLAWHDNSHCRRINYIVYGDTTHSATTTAFDTGEWYIHDPMGIDNVYKTEIRFEVKRGLWSTVSPDLYEFQYYVIQ